MEGFQTVKRVFILFILLLLLVACSSSDDVIKVDSDSYTPVEKDEIVNNDIEQKPDSQVTQDKEQPTDKEQTIDETNVNDADTEEKSDDAVDKEITADDEVVDTPTLIDEDVADDSSAACVDVETPDPVRLAPMEALEPPFPVQFTTTDGFNDYYLFGPGTDGTVLKIGIREEWGSTIIFYGLNYGNAGTNNSNTIDSNDTGREIQIAIYDPDRIVQGCAYNASCRTGGTGCSGGITYLGWNPVQGGNECNIGSGTESIDTTGKVLASSTIPLFWNPDWDLNSCDNGGCGDPSLQSRKSDIRYTQELRFVDENVVEMSMTIENLTNVAHAARAQEYPTIYTGYGEHGLQNYNKLIDSNKNEIAIDQPANDGFFKKDFTSPEGWVTLQNENKDYGIGLYNENKQIEYEGWQKAGTFNNVRASFVFGLPALGKVVARAYLILGSLDTVATLANKLDTTLSAFGTIDAPLADAHVSGTVSVGGWVLDNKGISTLRVLIDGKVVDTIPLTIKRDDVCLVYPGYSMCSGNSGFSKEVSLAGLEPCSYILEVEAEDTDGNKRVIDRKRIYVE